MKDGWCEKVVRAGGMGGIDTRSAIWDEWSGWGWLGREVYRYRREAIVMEEKERLVCKRLSLKTTLSLSIVSLGQRFVLCHDVFTRAPVYIAAVPY